MSFCTPSGSNSPMKGNYSATDETQLSFEMVSIDTRAKQMTVRECCGTRRPRLPRPCRSCGASPRPSRSYRRSSNSVLPIAKCCRRSLSRRAFGLRHFGQHDQPRLRRFDRGLHEPTGPRAPPAAKVPVRKAWMWHRPRLSASRLAMRVADYQRIESSIAGPTIDLIMATRSKYVSTA